MHKLLMKSKYNRWLRIYFKSTTAASQLRSSKIKGISATVPVALGEKKRVSFKRKD